MEGERIIHLNVKMKIVNPKGEMISDQKVRDIVENIDYSFQKIINGCYISTEIEDYE